MKVSLSVLNVDYMNAYESLKDIVDLVDYEHLDVMDGEFVPNISFGPDFVKSLKKVAKRPFDTHLMIMHPQNYIDKFVDAGSDYITFHVEADCNPMDVINQIKAKGVKAGISIKPKTSVEKIKKYLPYLDMVLVMSVEPGFGGQSFMENSIDKVKELKKLKDEFGYSYLINIDGGINNETAKFISPYVDLAVVGSYLTKANDKLDRLNLLKKL
ncbi:MAG: ribulose-phosphate 3-epimerase [Acholeplasmatales bacterium]|nr:ribulose-phosphate 3-epimerase [Acholeplasmatales bacterium]